MKHVPLKQKIRTGAGIILLFLFIVVPWLPGVQPLLSIPNEIMTYPSDTPITMPPLGDDVSLTANNTNIVTQDAELYPQQAGTSEVVIKKSDIPVKKMDVSVLADKKIIPGGESVGVQLHTMGVLVVGHHLVKAKESSQSPADAADILVGDVILEMNGNKISKMEDVQPIVKEAGNKQEKIKVKLKRGKEVVETSISPVLNKADNSYQIGLYIRDSASGIGTVSFYEADTGKYGALGHVISDADTKRPIELHKGKIVSSKITAIEKGNEGVPGEKQASFSMKDDALGTITRNSPFGIFGKLDTEKLDSATDKKPMPIALASEVKKGKAQIWTVVEGEKIEKFDVDVINTIPQKHPATKGMVIKVTDKKLLEKTGGIVQGMSGSPIIQDGKIIGAVTHVFVNDPTSGYGVHIEWMLDEAGIDIFKEDKKAS